MVTRVIILVLTLILLDGAWLGLIAKKLYINEIGGLMRMSNQSIQPLWPAAVVVYIALVLGILFFVLPKAGSNSLHALLWGALFGFVVYATYDCTNLSTLSQWSLKITLIDILWGMVLCGLSSFVTLLISK